VASFWQAKALALAAVLAVALLVAACGGDDVKPNVSATTSATAAATQEPGGDTKTATPKPEDTGTSGGNSDACKLLSKDSIESAVGEAVGDGQASSGGSKCTWTGTTNVGLTVSLTLTTGSGAAAFFNIDIGEVTSVQGLGDKAHWAEGLSVLEVLKGDVDFTLQVIDLTGDVSTRAKAEEMAADVVVKLP
jgi:hypothetical protein